MAARKKTTKKTVRKSASRSSAPKHTTRTTSSDRTMFLLAVSLVVAIVAYLFISAKSVTPTPPPTMKEKVATVVLDAQYKSGEAGTATLREVGGKVQVSISLAGMPRGVTQPAHIHNGSCPTPGEVKYPLTSIIDGKSETTIDVSFDDLMKQLPLAVNVHKSAAQNRVYVSCGNVTAPQY